MLVEKHVQCLVSHPSKNKPISVDIQIDIEEEILKEKNCKIINDTVFASILNDFFEDDIGIAFHASMVLHDNHRDIDYVGTVSAIVQRILDESKMLTKYVRGSIFSPMAEKTVEMDIETQIAKQVIEENNGGVIHDTVFLSIFNKFRIADINIILHQNMILHDDHREINYIGTTDEIIQRILDESE